MNDLKVTETITYADGSSASGPGPLPQVSPSGSPAVSVASNPAETPAEIQEAHQPSASSVPAVFIPAVGDHVTLEILSGKVVVDHEATVLAGTINDLSVAYFDPSQQNLLSSIDWRQAWVRVDRVKHIDNPDVAAGKEGFCWYHLSPEAAAEKVAAANKLAGEKAIAQAKKAADAQAAVLQAAADKRAAEQLKADKAAEAQKIADEQAQAKVKEADAKAQERAIKQASDPGVAVPSETQQKAEEDAAKRRTDAAEAVKVAADKAEAERLAKASEPDIAPQSGEVKK